MKLGQIVLVVYGVLLLAGALMGYLKAGSMASLVGGGVSGLAVIATFALSFRNRALAYLVGSGVAFALVCLFTWRLVKTGKFMPSGAMLAVSVVVILLLILAGPREAKGGGPAENRGESEREAD